MTELVFLTKYRLDRKGFFMKKLDKMTWEYCVFERMGVILTKCRNENTMFLSEWTFCWKIWAWGQVFLREKLLKLCLFVPLDFLEHKIVYFWQVWRFFNKYGHDSRGFYDYYIEKKDMRTPRVFERMDVFFDKIREREHCTA